MFREQREQILRIEDNAIDYNAARFGWTGGRYDCCYKRL